MKQFNRFVLFTVCLLVALATAWTGDARKADHPLKVSAVSPPPTDTLHGLIGYYYNDPAGNTQWFTTLVLTRVDSIININYGGGSPDPKVTADNYSVRWIGLIEAPVTGTYTFTTNTDDGSRLYINGIDIPGLDYWTSCCSDHSGSIDLVAGKKYPVVFEMHEIGGGAGVTNFQWQAPGIDKQQVPSKYLYAITPETASKPKISPVAGTYEGEAKITMSTFTEGGEIHYTLDGSDPTANSPIYDSTITLTNLGSTVIKAATYSNGMFASPIASATYTIIPPAVATPTFSPSAGNFDDSVAVSIEDVEDSITIYYTLDGTTPDTTTSPVYTPGMQIVIDSTTRVKALATKPGRTPSQIASATFTILPPAAKAPVFDVKEGQYDKPQTVTITSATAGAIIRYALDDNVLNSNSTVYTAPITISKTTTLKAYASFDTLRDSKVTTATYIIGNGEDKVEAPQFSIPGGEYNGVQQISLFTNTKGAIIHYTIDGSTPTDTSTVFFTPIPVNDSLTIKAIAEKEGMQASDIVSASYVIAGTAIDTSLISTKLPTPHLSISPNPASDMARISWTNMVYTLSGARVTVTDSRGAVIDQVLIKGGYTYYEMNTSRLADGIYFVKVVSGSSVAHGKLIIGR